MPEPQASKPITIRFPADLIERITKLAEVDIRSFNGEVIYLLRYAVSHMGDPDQSS